MTEKRFKLGYVCGDYGLIDNDDVENKWTDFYSMSANSEKNVQICIRKMNELADENEQLKNRVDELEDDNMKYTLSTDKLEEYTKRFMPTKCINEFRDCKTNRYYWLDNEDNFTGALELLNLLDCENEQLKKELEDALLDVKIYKNANTTFDNVYQENEKLKSRIEYLERKIEMERNATNKQYEKWEKEALEKINKLEKGNEQLNNRVKDLEELNRIYVDFLVEKGYELSDVMKGDVE